MAAGKTILILGGGVGGIVAATALRRLLASEHRVVLVEKEANHVFSPSLLWLMIGKRSPGQISRRLLYLGKGRSNQGGYHGAHWHTVREVRSLLDELAVDDYVIRSAIFLPGGSGIARAMEHCVSNRVPLGAFLVAAGRVPTSRALPAGCIELYRQVAPPSNSSANFVQHERKK